MITRSSFSSKEYVNYWLYFYMFSLNQSMRLIQVKNHKNRDSRRQTDRQKYSQKHTQNETVLFYDNFGVCTMHGNLSFSTVIILGLLFSDSVVFCEDLPMPSALRDSHLSLNTFQTEIKTCNLFEQRRTESDQSLL